MASKTNTESVEGQAASTQLMTVVEVHAVPPHREEANNAQVLPIQEKDRQNVALEGLPEGKSSGKLCMKIAEFRPSAFYNKNKHGLLVATCDAHFYIHLQVVRKQWN